MSQTWSYTSSCLKSMPCPKHGLTLTIVIEANAMSQTWSYNSSCISVPMLCPRHGLTLTPLYVPMPCPKHGLTLAYFTRPMHVPNMSYTSSRLNVDAMSQIWSYTGSQ
ncbi:hypothetical protein F383_36220 [Gossypium arboreum]|uniref:Uncharacterized protein n=1 Tax=Gossypium arboreum TaxID=29729 RepID=A0A0B0N8C1_GOSAR|nr:hypothetical protein F383_36220 [Gossypium arboreum]